MGFTYWDKVRGSTSITNVGTNAGVTVASSAAAAGKYYSPVSFDASGDAAALLTIESPAGTVIWRKRFAGAFTTSGAFDPGMVKGADGQLIQIKISASTSNCEANLQAVLL